MIQVSLLTRMCDQKSLEIMALDNNPTCTLGLLKTVIHIGLNTHKITHTHTQTPQHYTQNMSGWRLVGAAPFEHVCFPAATIHSQRETPHGSIHE